MQTSKRRLYIYLPIVFALLLVLGIFIGLQLQGEEGHSGLFTKVATIRKDRDNKIANVIDYIEREYVDSVDRKYMVEEALKQLLQNLDPHSAYISMEELQAMNEPLQGNFEGIGIEFNIIDDTIRVVSAISGGPSEAVGILAGDKIVSIEGEVAAGIGITNKTVISKLRGEGGTQVTIGISRRGVANEMEFTITRGTIPIYSVDASYMLSSTIGYIKISRFAATTYDEFVKASKSLLEKGMNKMVLDLRGNPGGLLSAAVDISDEFLKKGKQIVYTEGKAHKKKVHRSTGSGNLEEVKLAVLIDEGSASASEIVAGAIQDNDRGYIIGRRSFGKGLVQEQTEFTDGSAIRLTIARYYTPTGRCIQKPYEDGNEKYFMEELNRFEHGELADEDSIPINDSLKFFTPAGKVVYGGGGILPDKFVPIDTSGRSELLYKIVNTGLLNKFSYNYSDKLRTELKKNYKDGEGFAAGFKVGSSDIKELEEYLLNEKMIVPKDQLMHSTPWIKRQLKALVGRNVFGNLGYYATVHQSDFAVQEALEVLK